MTPGSQQGATQSPAFAAGYRRVTASRCTGRVRLLLADLPHDMLGVSNPKPQTLHPNPSSLSSRPQHDARKPAGRLSESCKCSWIHARDGAQVRLLLADLPHCWSCLGSYLQHAARQPAERLSEACADSWTQPPPCSAMSAGRLCQHSCQPDCITGLLSVNKQDGHARKAIYDG